MGVSSSLLGKQSILEAPFLGGVWWEGMAQAMTQHCFVSLFLAENMLHNNAQYHLLWYCARG
jgi:hypothetical protein